MKTHQIVLILLCISIIIGIFIYFINRYKYNNTVLKMELIPFVKNLPEYKIKSDIVILQQQSIYNKNNELYAEYKNLDFQTFNINKSQWQHINNLIQKEYEYVVYLSANMKILDYTKDIRRIIQQGGDSDMIICRDENDSSAVNLDVIIFRKSEWTLYKLQQLYWADINNEIDYELIIDQIYGKNIPKYKLSNFMVNNGLPYILSNTCVYNEHAFNSSRSSFIFNNDNSSFYKDKIDIYPWKSVDGYVEIEKSVDVVKNITTDRKIPKNIFQTMETSLIPIDIYNNQQKLIKINPGYSYFFFDSLDRRIFIKNNFPSYIINMYDKILPGAYKSDIWRYCILYKYGGCYIDMMMSMLKSLDSIIGKNDILIASRPTYDICKDCVDQGFLLSKPNNKILLQIIKYSCMNIEYENTNHCLDITGPKLLYKVLKILYPKTLDENIKFLVHNHDLGLMTYNNENIIKTKLGNKWNLNYIPGLLTHYSMMYKNIKIFKPLLYSLDIKFDWSLIDGIIYINLDNRKDRKKHINNEFNKVGIPRNKIIRLSATKHSKGHIGCAHSHMRACQLALDNNWKNVIIFEDDFKFVVGKNTMNKLFNSLFNYVDEWDGITLSASTIIKKPCTYSSFLSTNLGSLTSSGYLINNHMMSLLRDSNELSYNKLMDGKSKNEFACDVQWQKIQKKYKWYIFNPKMGKQIVSYSDIEKKVINYNKLE